MSEVLGTIMAVVFIGLCVFTRIPINAIRLLDLKLTEWLEEAKARKRKQDR